MKAQVARTNKVAKVVITRSKKGNSELAHMLDERGFEAIPIDTLEFLPPDDWTPVDAALWSLDDFDWLLITSATGAKFLARRMHELSLPFNWRGKPSVAAVGEKTAAALRKEGIKVDFVPSTYLTKALAEQLPRELGKDVLILRADIGSPEAVEILRRDGFTVTDLTIYKTSSSDVVRLDDATASAVLGADAIIFASPSAVKEFVGLIAGRPDVQAALTKDILALCIGPVTAAAAKRHGFTKIITPESHTIESVLASLESALASRDAKAGEGPSC